VSTLGIITIIVVVIAFAALLFWADVRRGQSPRERRFLFRYMLVFTPAIFIFLGVLFWVNATWPDSDAIRSVPWLVFTAFYCLQARYMNRKTKQIRKEEASSSDSAASP
jgi:membrane-bound acyltransferase YfiQ involved in biofilm formation